jgi:hypothetical protein
MCMSYNNLPENRVYAPDAVAIGVLADAMMSNRVYDLVITALVGGLVWLMVSAVGLR